LSQQTGHHLTDTIRKAAHTVHHHYTQCYDYWPKGRLAQLYLRIMSKLLEFRGGRIAYLFPPGYDAVLAGRKAGICVEAASSVERVMAPNVLLIGATMVKALSERIAWSLQSMQGV
jgi:hypothetical protein